MSLDGAHLGVRRGFTLTELLVAIAVLGLIVGILAVALSGALTGGRRAATAAQLQGIGNAVEAFRLDFERPPGLITGLETSGAVRGVTTPGLRAALDPGLDSETEAARENGFYSEFTLATMLIGVGDVDGDGEEFVDASPGPGEFPGDDGVQGTGLRDPGPFGCWVFGAGTTLERRSSADGRVYGPYLETGSASDSVQRVLVEEREVLGRRGLYRSPSAGVVLYRLLDPFGNPVRYYTGWPTRTVVGSRAASTLSRTPVELRTEESVRSAISAGEAASVDLVHASDRALLSAPYALLSPGQPSPGGQSTGEEEARSWAFGDVLTSRSANGRRIGFTTDGASAFHEVVGAEGEERELFRTLRENVRYLP